MMVVVDASVWVSRLVPDDVNHIVSKQWLEQYSVGDGRLLAPGLLLVEVAAAVSRRTGKINLARAAARRIQRLPELKLVAMDNHLISQATEIAADFGLRGADAIYVAVARHLKVPLVTWDRDQKDRSEKVIAVYTPDSLLKSDEMNDEAQAR